MSYYISLLSLRLISIMMIHIFSIFCANWKFSHFWSGNAFILFCIWIISENSVLRYLLSSCSRYNSNVSIIYYCWYEISQKSNYHSLWYISHLFLVSFMIFLYLWCCVSYYIVTNCEFIWTYCTQHKASFFKLKTDIFLWFLISSFIQVT